MKTVGPFNPVRRILKEARRQLFKGNSRKAVDLLEGLAGSGQDDRYLHLLLAVAYLYIDEFSLSEKALAKCSAKSSDYPPCHELQAFLSLKSAPDHASAVAVYSALSNRFPRNLFIIKLLDRVLHASPFEELQRESRLADYVEIPAVPKITAPAGSRHFRGWTRRITPADTRKRRAPIKYILLLTGCLALAAVSAAVFMLRDSSMSMFSRETKNAEALDMLSLDGSAYDLVTGTRKTGERPFYLSSREVVDDFNKAKKLAVAGKYNESLALLNRIQYANVSFAVKEKTDFLIRWIINVEERAYPFIPYSDVAASPHLYRGYSLKWRGRVANLVKRRETYSFTLMVDYQDRQTLSGIAEVYHDGQLPGVNNGSMVEIEGVITGFIGDQKRIYLVARSIDLVD